MNARTAWLLACLCLAAAAPESQACGEVMYRMGSALRYRAFVTRHPAQVLVYAGRGALVQTDDEHARFHDDLERAGHHVTLVRDPEALELALARQHFDVIIASTGDLAVISTRTTQAREQPTLLPVVRRVDGDPKQWRARYPRLLSENANLNQFLKAIEQMMNTHAS